MSAATFLQAFLQERYEKDEKYFTVYDNYRPKYKEQRVTRKFYSKYESIECDYVDPKLIEEIKKHTTASLQERYSWPATENQWYGWFKEPIIELDRSDRRYYHPKLGTDFIKHELRLKQDEADFPKPKFTGIPFKVQ